jgi:uncharacterized protein (DUF4415 family)
MPNLKKNTILPTRIEDKAINLGISQDEDTYELNAKEFKQLSKIGRPKLENTKSAISVRLDKNVIQTFKAAGRGWQTRINKALNEWIKTHDMSIANANSTKENFSSRKSSFKTAIKRTKNK